MHISYGEQRLFALRIGFIPEYTLPNNTTRRIIGYFYYTRCGETKRRIWFKRWSPYANLLPTYYEPYLCCHSYGNLRKWYERTNFIRLTACLWKGAVRRPWKSCKDCGYTFTRYTKRYRTKHYTHGFTGHRGQLYYK